MVRLPCSFAGCPCRDDRYLSAEDRIVIDRKHFGIAEERMILRDAIMRWLLMDQSEKANERKIGTLCIREWNDIPSSREGRIFESDVERDFWLGVGMGGHLYPTRAPGQTGAGR